MLDTTVNPVNELMLRQSRYSDQMVWFAVLLLLAGALTGLGYQWGWWWMAFPAAIGLVMAWNGYKDARRQWLATIAEAKTSQHLLRTNAETPAAGKPLVLDPEGFLDGR